MLLQLLLLSIINKLLLPIHDILFLGERKSGILKPQSSSNSDIKPVLRNVDFDSMFKKNQDTEAKQVNILVSYCIV